MAQDKAGERIVNICAERRTAAIEAGEVRVYKNNTDFEGHSYGCHENYLMAREVPFDRIVSGLLPFFATRQIFAGAGKVGEERGDRAPIYQLSQRSEFFEVIASVDTMHKRPLINTRDEPHADSERWRRLHVIVGDANMSEFATALKVGTTALIVDMIEADRLPDFRLRDPIAALRNVAKDQTYQWLVEVEGQPNQLVPSVDIQRAYLALAQEDYAGRDDETDWVLRSWEDTLDALEADPMSLVGTLDWVTKKYLIDSFCDEESLSWDNPDHLFWMQSQDLEYHNVDQTLGLYYLLEAQGQFVRLVDDGEVAKAMAEPPERTRAYFRGRSLEKFREEVKSINWDRIVFGLNGRHESIDLKPMVDSDLAQQCNVALDASATVAQLIDELKKIENHPVVA